MLPSPRKSSSVWTNDNSNAATIISSKRISFSEALDLVGGDGGWYQIRAFLVFSAQWFFAAWILLGSQFILFPAQFDSEFCGDLSQSDCKKKACESPNPTEYMTNATTSMIGTLDLVCSEIHVSLMQSLPYIGSLIGFFTFSWIADNRGRRVALRYSWMFASLGAMLLALSWDYYSAITGLFIAGFGVNPAITIALSFLSGKFREYSTIGVQAMYGVGECALIGIAYVFPNWRTMALYFLALPMVVINFFIVYIFESPKFEYERNVAQGVSILNRIARVNQRDPIHEYSLEDTNNSKGHDDNYPVTTYSVSDLFKYASLRKTTISCSLLFFSIQGVYYGGSFAMSRIGLDLYTNSIIIAIAETIAYIVTDHFIPSLRRKKTIMIGMGICSILLFCYEFLDSPTDCKLCSAVILQIVFASIVRFLICFVWAVCYVQMTELFPTVVKSLALGVVSGSGTIGSSMSPYVGDFSQNLGISPMISLGLIGMIGFGSVMTLKETKGKPLEDQISELKTDEMVLLGARPEKILE